MRLLYNLYKLKRQMEFADPVINLKDKSRLKGSAKDQTQGFATAKYMQASFIKDVEDMFKSELDNGLTFKEIQKIMIDKLSNRGWLPNDKQIPSRIQLIIHNAVSVSKAKDSFNKQMQTKDYYPYLQWVQQERTNQRDSHKALAGKVFSKDDPDLLNLYPPKGFNCNCYMKNITQKEFDKNKFEITPVNDAVKDLDSSSKDYGGLNWKPDLSLFPKEIQKKLGDAFDGGKEEIIIYKELNLKDENENIENYIMNFGKSNEANKEILDVFKKDKKNYLSSLDKDTINWVSEYCGKGYSKINKSLRNGENSLAYNRLKDGDLSFGIKDNTCVLRAETYYMNNRFVERLQEVKDGGFAKQLMSTTISADCFEKFSGLINSPNRIIYKINLPKGTKVGIGNFQKEEYEYILDLNTKTKIKSITYIDEKKENILIELDVIN